jgi:hypothetical protein
MSLQPDFCHARPGRYLGSKTTKIAQKMRSSSLSKPLEFDEFCDGVADVPQ